MGKDEATGERAEADDRELRIDRALAAVVAGREARGQIDGPAYVAAIRRKIATVPGRLEEEEARMRGVGPTRSAPGAASDAQRASYRAGRDEVERRRVAVDAFRRLPENQARDLFARAVAAAEAAIPTEAVHRALLLESEIRDRVVQFVAAEHAHLMGEVVRETSDPYTTWPTDDLHEWSAEWARQIVAARGGRPAAANLFTGALGGMGFRGMRGARAGQEAATSTAVSTPKETSHAR